ncbi:MAG: hypothetical protein K0S39_5349, partial [Paenibacillus sp.]|nr:hypothetical protein [Paenibacillus sp.]
KNYGLRVYGLEIPFTYEITAETLVKYVVRNMNTYWVSWIERLENQLLVSGISEQTIRADELDQAVEWCVLGMLRQVYTIKEHGITSKIRAGEYGMTFLPNQWHGLIREAIAVKRCEPTRVYISQFKRMSDLVELLRLILLEANQSYRNAYNS